MNPSTRARSALPSSKLLLRLIPASRIVHTYVKNRADEKLKLLYVYTVLEELHFLPGIALARLLNYRVIELHQGTVGETVPVLKRNGGYKEVQWRGFMTVAAARAAKGKPVKLRVDRVRRYTSAGHEWEDVPAGKHVQGCVTADGCYAVLAGDIRLV